MSKCTLFKVCKYKAEESATCNDSAATYYCGKFREYLKELETLC